MDSTTDPRLVYLIDDDASVHRTLSGILTAHGFDPAEFDSAERFLRQYTDRGPACVICDVRVPGLSGLEMLDRMDACDIRHPVILMTSYGDVETVVSCFRSGAVDFFEKPIRPEVLVERVNEAIARDMEARRAHDLRRRTLEAIATLSPRERQVMEMLFAGQPNKTIAHLLYLSEKTVAAHRAHILTKMGVESLPELVRLLMAARMENDLAIAA